MTLSAIARSKDGARHDLVDPTPRGPRRPLHRTWVPLRIQAAGSANWVRGTLARKRRWLKGLAHVQIILSHDICDDETVFKCGLPIKPAMEERAPTATRYAD
jgi:hypothetical protein